MNRNPQQLEELLSSQKEVGLTSAEKSTMFAELQAFAELHRPVVSVGTPLHQRLAWVSRWSVAVAAVFFVLVGTGAASTQSLPGDSLYVVKVSVVEPLVGLAYVNETDQLVYQLALMERRLLEMETLYRADDLTEDIAVVLESQISDQTKEFNELITTAELVEINPMDSLEAVSNISVTLQKQAYLVERELGVTRPSQLDEAQVAVETVYQNELQEFVATTPEAATEYVADLLTEVNEQVAADPDIASSSAVELSEYLEDVEATLETGNLKQAVEFADDATQLLETNRFFEAVTEDPEAVAPTES